ncbi:glutathione peroxidase [Nisaea nitritireducens]|uniref:glutathione peroxidase n=1 Tax=Nisaea nitritireducens TaxID=568392 RepID=UPI0018676197
MYFRAARLASAILIGLLLMPAGQARAANAHDFSFVSIEGDPLSMKEYAGQAVLVVNTASFCGFTKQYEGLQTLWERYKERGLVVLGVPSNDFGSQEPGTAAEIKEFCAVNFAVDFPMTEKQVVSGDQAHPFYRWAAKELGTLSKPRWNFYKILIAPDGKAIDWFASTTAPSSAKLIKAVEAALPR